MNKKTIGSLVKGLLILLLIVAATFIYKDTRNDIKISNQSRIGADSYDLGIEYSGLIDKELVSQGDFVHKGDPLAYIKSSSLLADLGSKKVAKADLAYPLSESNEIIMLATQDGVLQDVNYLTGSYVPANQYIFKITAEDTPYVTSHFNLARDDFQRLNKSTLLQVKLPNGQIVDSPIQQISVDTGSQLSGLEVPVTIKSTIKPDRNLLIGSPVTANLHLNRQTQLQRIAHFLKGL